MAETKPYVETHNKTLSCSFCQKPQNEVRYLIAGEGVAICNECTMLCWEILAEQRVRDSDTEDRKELALEDLRSTVEDMLNHLTRMGEKVRGDKGKPKKRKLLH